jgi:Arc/MetJ family transcription regulator
MEVPMRTNIVLDDALVAEALRLSGIKTKKDLIDEALRVFIAAKKRKISSISKARSNSRRTTITKLCATQSRDRRRLLGPDRFFPREAQPCGQPAGESRDRKDPFSIAGCLLPGSPPRGARRA